MKKTIEYLEKECEQTKREARKYPKEDKRRLYYMGCLLGLQKALNKIRKNEDIS